MTSLLQEKTVRLNARKGEGRVINQIAAWLRRRLSVPHIYLEPRGPSFNAIDVLAVDRGGSGDAHGVEVKILPILPTRTGITKLIAPLKTSPSHYRYLAVQASEDNLDKWMQLRKYDELFDTTGIGRIGVISFDERLLQKNAEFDPALIQLIVYPERFVLRGDKLDALEKFLKRPHPDIQVRI